MKHYGIHKGVPFKPSSPKIPMKTFSNKRRATDCRVGRTVIGKNVVSTVFLCMDHYMGAHLKPSIIDKYVIEPAILFETMLFSDNLEWEGFQVRAVTKGEALHCHNALVRTVTKAVGDESWKELHKMYEMELIARNYSALELSAPTIHQQKNNSHQDL